MDFKLTIGLLLACLPALCSASEDSPVQLDVSTLSEIRFKLRHVTSRPQQCALYFVAVSSKLGISVPNDDRPLIERVDISLLTTLSESIKSKSGKLSDYLKDCATLIRLLRQERVVGPEHKVIKEVSDETEEKKGFFTNPAKLFQKISDSKRAKDAKLDEVISSQQVDPEPKTTTCEAELAELKEELERKAKQLQDESLMHQADLVAIGFKEKALRKELLKRNEDLTAEVDSFKQKVVSLESDRLKALKDSSEQEALRRKEALDAELEIAKKKSDDCATKARELELLEKIEHLEKELKVEKDHNEQCSEAQNSQLVLERQKNDECFIKTRELEGRLEAELERNEQSTRTFLVDISQLRGELVQKDDSLRQSRSQFEAVQRELVTNQEALQSVRRELMNLSEQFRKCLVKVS